MCVCIIRGKYDLEQNLQILWKRVPMWKKLSHENILPFRGVNMTLFQLALVYDWGQHGNISQYLTSHPSASRPALVRNLLPRKRKITNVFSMCMAAVWRRERVTIPSLARHPTRGFEGGRLSPSDCTSTAALVALRSPFLWSSVM